MKKIPKDVISAIILVAFGISIWVYSGTFPQLDTGYPGPALFPRVVAVGLGIGGLLLGIFALRTSQNTEETRGSSSPPSWLFGIFGLLLAIIFPPIRDVLGFVPALVITCFGIALLLRVKVSYALATALLTAGFTYGIFHFLLGVPL